MLVLLVAGCGGDDGRSAQEIRGVGYSFNAPDGWRVTRAGRTITASGDDESRTAVSVTRFKLAARYEPRLAAGVTRELDRVAGVLAAKLGGAVDGTARPRIAGRRAWAYDLSGTRDGTHRIGFVLAGRDEFQLLCRREADDGDDESCRLLFASFRLGP